VLFAVAIDIGRLKTFHDKGDSGQAVDRNFCPECGSPVFTDAAVMPGVAFIKASTPDDTSWLEPKLQYWVRTRLSWSTRPGEEKLAAQAPFFPPEFLPRAWLECPSPKRVIRDRCRGSCLPVDVRFARWRPSRREGNFLRASLSIQGRVTQQSTMSPMCLSATFTGRALNATLDKGVVQKTLSCSMSAMKRY
jgi:Glutathione-dependent formaldehyde-activating enzyme